MEVAHDGHEGLWLATESTLDVIVLDIMLPGPERLPDLRDAARAGRVDADPDAHREGRRVGRGRGPRHRRRRLPRRSPSRSPVLRGPAPRAAAADAPERAGAEVAVGDLSIDPAARRCARGDAEIDLTAREFEVLEFLVRRAGEVAVQVGHPRRRVAHDFDGDPNIVEVYVRRLRRTIDEPFGRQVDRDGPRRRLSRAWTTGHDRAFAPGAHRRDAPSCSCAWCSR